MAIDRPGDENVEKQRATDAPPPPPPPDRPGEEGYPSRAESKAFAAAAAEKNRREDTSDTDSSAPESAIEERDSSREDREDDVSDAPDRSDHEPVDENGADAEGSDPAKPSGDAADSADGEERVPVFEWQTEDGRLARAYLDDLRPPGDMSNERPEPTDPEADRMGARIVDETESEGSLLERFRREGYGVADDLFDAVKEEANRTKDLFDRPPTGSHTVDRPPDHAMIDAPHHGVDAGDAVTSVLGTAIFISDLFYRGAHGIMRRKKEDDNARD